MLHPSSRRVNTRHSNYSSGTLINAIGAEATSIFWPHHPNCSGTWKIEGALPYSPWIELVDDALEPDHCEQAGGEATDPGQEENGECDEARITGIFFVFLVNSRHVHAGSYVRALVVHLRVRCTGRWDAGRWVVPRMRISKTYFPE